jgi:hypothetical protein
MSDELRCVKYYSIVANYITFNNISGTKLITLGVWLMVFNATFKFNNISLIWWWSVLLVEEIGIPGENH